MSSDEKESAQERKKRALRENLKRRKAQTREIKAGSGILATRKPGLSPRMNKADKGGED